MPLRIIAANNIFFWVIAAAAVCPNASAAKRVVRYDDISGAHRVRLARQGVDATGFDDYVRSLAQRTARREAEGENDHLIYFILQSRRFTHRPAIEPAISAREFVSSLDSEERTRYFGGQHFTPPAAKVPSNVARRCDDFIRALARPVADERISYLKSFLERSKDQHQPLRQYLHAQYARSMRFLYEKEFASRENRGGGEAAEAVAALYRNRGHSTDTQVEANYAVYTALAVIGAQGRGARRLNNVLIVGPGLDFAPRTGLLDFFDPQSYQPFAIADALLGLRLADREELRIHSVDINDRVISYLREFPARRVREIALFSGVADTGAHSLTADYKRFFEALGRNIGSPARAGELPARYQKHLTKSLRVNSEIGGIISAEKLDIITERYDPSPRYDLVVVTNVFPYFNDAELLLALTNIESMLSDGGYLIHNESRPALVSLAEELRLRTQQARTVLIASSPAGTPLYDSVYIHQK